MSVNNVDNDQISLLQVLDSFTRNTTLNDVNKLLHKSIFLQFDKVDVSTGVKDGKFNDSEWNAFESFRNKIRSNTKSPVVPDDKINKQAVEYYTNLVQDFEKQAEKIGQEWEKLFEVDYFAQMYEFENAHNIRLMGLKDESEKQENTVDIEPFLIGIAREEKGKYEGIYKKGYIKGFENLTKEQQEEYMNLYNKAIEQCKKAEKLGDKEGKIIERLHQAIIMKDACETGVVTTDYLSKDTINKTVEAWNSKNPYLPQIQNLEKQIAEERLKLNSDAGKIQNLQNMLNGLYQASEMWSFKYGEVENNQEQNSSSAQFNASGELTTIHSDESSEGEFLSEGVGVHLNYGTERNGITADMVFEDKFRIKTAQDESGTSKNFKQTKTFGLSSRFGIGQFNFRHNSAWNFDDDFKMQNHSLNLSYDKTTLAFNKNIRTMPMPELNPATGEETLTDKSTASTTLSLSQQIGNGNTSVSMSSADNGKTYTASGSYTFTKKFGKNGENTNHIELSLTPSVNYNYLKLANTQQDSFEDEYFISEQPSNIQTLSFGANLNAGFKYKKLSGNLNVNKNLTTQFPQTTNNLTTVLNLNYKNFGIKTAHTVMSSNQMNMNTFATGISYNNGTVEVGAEYSRAGTTSMMPDSKDEMAENTNICKQLMVTAKIYIDKLFK